MNEPNEIEKMADRCAELCMAQLRKSLRLPGGGLEDPSLSPLEHARLDADLRHRLSLGFEKILVSPLALPAALKEALPVVVYFKTDRERGEFINIMRAAHPGLTAKRF